MTIEIANRLYELRKRYNLSQEELAERLGVSRQAVSKWERGEASPDTDNLIALAKIYGLSLDELIYGENAASTEDADTAREDTDGEEISEEETEQWEPKSKIARFWFELPYPLICVVAYLIFGFTGFLGGWHPAWIIFVTIPIYHSLVEAIYKHRFSDFAYPVFVTVVYLVLGCYFDAWHPSWLVFITVPIYYHVASLLDRKIKR